MASEYQGLKVTVERTTLLQGIQKVQSIVEKKSTVAILGNILLSVSGKILSLASTDLEVGVRVSVTILAGNDGRLTVSPKHIHDIVKELPEQTLDLRQKDTGLLEIVCGKSRFTIVSLPAEHYPALPQFEDILYLPASAKHLAKMIDRTQFAIPVDSTKIQINGIYLEPKGDGFFRMTATDGHRLSYIDEKILLQGGDVFRGVIVPKKGIIELRKLLDGKEEIGLHIERGTIFAKVGPDYLFIRLIEGEFPDYNRIIPQDNTSQLTVNRQALTAAIRRVGVLASDKYKGMKLALRADGLQISSSNPDMGEAVEEMDAQFNGEPLEIGFNAKYLLECLVVMTSETLDVYLKDPLRPVIIKDQDVPQHSYVLMPMRV